MEIFEIKSRFLKWNQSFFIYIKIFKINSKFLETNPDSQKEIEILKMKSQSSKLILDFQNDIEILNVLSVFGTSQLPCTWETRGTRLGQNLLYLFYTLYFI